MIAPTVRKAWLSANAVHRARTMVQAVRTDSATGAAVTRLLPVAFLVFFSAAAGAGVVAARRRFLADGLDPRPHAAPQLAQVVHGPDGGAEIVHPLLAHAGRAVLGVHRERRLAGVVLGQRDDGAERLVEHPGRLLVARRRPVLGPVLDRIHEAQRPHLGEG